MVQYINITLKKIGLTGLSPFGPRSDISASAACLFALDVVSVLLSQLAGLPDGYLSFSPLNSSEEEGDNKEKRGKPRTRASKDLCFERFLGSGVSGRQNMLLIVPLFLMMGYCYYPFQYNGQNCTATP
eukprot:scaffold1639_cov104-Skeletonema_dohrnii-CCMP3373.AAC.2